MKSHESEAQKDAVILETAYLSEKSAFSRKIGLTVRHLPTGSLDDAPDYTMRVQNDGRYKKDSFDLDGVRGIIFSTTDQGSFEKSYFVQHGNLLMMMTFSAPGAEDESFDVEANNIVRGIDWRR